MPFFTKTDWLCSLDPGAGLAIARRHSHGCWRHWGKPQQSLGFRKRPPSPHSDPGQPPALPPPSPFPGPECWSRTPGWGEWSTRAACLGRHRLGGRSSRKAPCGFRGCTAAGRGPQPTTCLLTCCGAADPAPALSGPVSSPTQQALLHSQCNAGGAHEWRVICRDERADLPKRRKRRGSELVGQDWSGRLRPGPGLPSWKCSGQAGRCRSSEIRTLGQDPLRPSPECSGAASSLCHRLLPVCPYLCPREPQDELSELPALKVTETHLQSQGHEPSPQQPLVSTCVTYPNSGSQVLKWFW